MTKLSDVILRDATGNRPAAGIEGRLFFDTTLNKLQRDSGSDWEDVEAGAGVLDAGDLTYTPATATDWDSDTDPGDLDDAVDQLAERVDDLEGISVATDSIWDAAGDLIQGTGADTAARLALGTAYQKLSVNSGATAVEWTTGGRVLISEATPSGTDTVTFSSIPGTFKNLHLEWVIRGLKSAADDSLSITFNSDTTAANYRRVRNASYGNTTNAVQAGDDAIPFYVSAANAPSNACASGWAKILQYAGTTFNKRLLGHNAYRYDASGSLWELSQFTSMEWESAAAITQIDMVLGGGNYVAGSVVRLYGET